jgi:hypothetical protein
VPHEERRIGKSVKAYYVDAVKIDGFEQMKKGGTTFRVPKFGSSRCRKKRTSKPWRLTPSCRRI